MPLSKDIPFCIFLFPRLALLLSSHTPYVVFVPPLTSHPFLWPAWSLVSAHLSLTHLLFLSPGHRPKTNKMHWHHYHKVDMPKITEYLKQYTVIPHRPYKWIEKKNALVARHPTAVRHPSIIRHLQVLPFCLIPIVMSFTTTRALFVNDVLCRFYHLFNARLDRSLQWEIRVFELEQY